MREHGSRQPQESVLRPAALHAAVSKYQLQHTLQQAVPSIQWGEADLSDPTWLQKGANGPLQGRSHPQQRRLTDETNCEVMWHAVVSCRQVQVPQQWQHMRRH